MNIKYRLRYLTEDFYKIYNEIDYPEIEHKLERPYMVFLVKIDNNTYAIPFRTNVKHKWCYKFKNTSRDTKYAIGLVSFSGWSRFCPALFKYKNL